MNQFLEASGASGPLLLGVGVPGSADQETRAFDLPFVLVGRDPRSDLRLDSPEVSERHAYFQIVSGQLFCIDLGSRIGVYYGGRCRRSSQVERDQVVRIGPYRLRLLAGDALQDVAGWEANEESAPVLVLSHRLLRQSRSVLPKGLSLVGSAADCGIRLIDPSVSNYHCSVIRTPQGVWIVDLLSAGGVRVNGQDVGYARLYDGDEVEIGHSVLRLGSQRDTSASVVPVEPPPPPPLESVVESVVEGAPAIPPHMPVAFIPRALEPDRAGTGEVLQVAHAADLVDRIVAPLIQQFGMLQQQMVDEMNQSRALMFDTFASMHQEQSSFLNRELEQLRQLSQELQTLRADLERQTRLFLERAPATMPALTNGGSHHLATFPREHGYGSERRPSARPSHDSGSQRGSRRQDPRHPLRPDHAPSARATNPMAENPRAPSRRGPGQDASLIQIGQFERLDRATERQTRPDQRRNFVVVDRRRTLNFADFTSLHFTFPPGNSARL